MVASLCERGIDMAADAKELLQNSQKTKALRPDDIPDLDLYMDQIIALMSAHLGESGEKEPLTRTMIHNYSKAGLISPVKGKKYTKEHILQMLVIYSLKNTLSIAQVKRVLNGAAMCGVGEKELTDCFNTQLERREHLNDRVTDAMVHIMEETGMKLETPADALSFLLTLTDITDTFTAFASAIAQEYFPEPELPKKSKKK